MDNELIERVNANAERVRAEMIRQAEHEAKIERQVAAIEKGVRTFCCVAFGLNAVFLTILVGFLMGWIR